MQASTQPARRASVRCLGSAKSGRQGRCSRSACSALQSCRQREQIRLHAAGQPGGPQKISTMHSCPQPFTVTPASSYRRKWLLSLLASLQAPVCNCCACSSEQASGLKAAGICHRCLPVRPCLPQPCSGPCSCERPASCWACPSEPPTHRWSSSSGLWRAPWSPAACAQQHQLCSESSPGRP